MEPNVWEKEVRNMPVDMKGVIAEAFLKMIQRNGLDKITVKALIEECHISRQTFYYHFQDIMDVLEWSMGQTVEHLVKKSLQAEDLHSALQIFVSFSVENFPMLQKLMDSQRRAQIERMLMDGMVTYLQELSQNSPGMHFTACAPKSYFPSQELVEQCRQIAAQTGASITLTEDAMEGTRDADVICTDVWVSMGEPDSVWEERIELLSPYQVNRRIMENADNGKAGSTLFMHCLPAFHDLKTTIGKKIGEKFGISEMEVTDEVFESPASVVFDEAENRMHTIKAVIAATLGYQG